VLLEIYEGRSETETVTTPITPPPEGDEEEVEEETVKTRIMVPERKIAVLKVRDVKKNSQIEVFIQIDSEGKVTIVAREIGRKDGSVTKIVLGEQAS
jgi:hypothetical protein